MKYVFQKPLSVINDIPNYLPFKGRSLTSLTLRETSTERMILAGIDREALSMTIVNTIRDQDQQG